MSKLLFATLCFLVMVISTGCKHEENHDDKVTLENNVWTLQRYGFMEEALTDLPPNKLSTLHFNADNKLVKGVVLCNRFESTYNLTENNISIVSVTPTEIFCGENEEEIISFIVTSLSSINRYEINDNGLIIYTVESRVLQYGKE